MTGEAEKDYVLGTHDAEIARLGVQHRVWRPRVLDAWQRAAFTAGRCILDVGCGPGYAAIDLAEIVGPGGRVHAIDRSRRFLDVLERERASRGLAQIVTHELDLARSDLPEIEADGAWTRWVYAFVEKPRDLLARVAARLKRGAPYVIFEYCDYGAWRIAPRSQVFEDFVTTMIRSWRESGGEPDVGLDLPRWLDELGFEVRSLTPIAHVVPATSFVWQWPDSFIGTGVARLVSLGKLERERAEALYAAYAECKRDPRALMVTPTVMEIIAVRR